MRFDKKTSAQLNRVQHKCVLNVVENKGTLRDLRYVRRCRKAVGLIELAGNEFYCALLVWGASRGSATKVLKRWEISANTKEASRVLRFIARETDEAEMDHMRVFLGMEPLRRAATESVIGWSP